MEMQRCITCGELHTPGVDAVCINHGEFCQCAWCHYSEWGTWPHGMTMEDKTELSD